MKIAKLRVLGAVAFISAMGFSTVAWAYVPEPYCSNLEKNWKGTFENWVDWITMCS